MSDRHSFLSDNFYVGSDNVQRPTVILSTEHYHLNFKIKKIHAAKAYKNGAKLNYVHPFTIMFII